jgi:NAD(P)-dependent dehydrogenase (short-subunit alcohol dehydrogenase family)
MAFACIGEFAITEADTSAFADLSGDFNPVHIDATAARRLLFGSAVPHGIHVLLSGLDIILRESSHAIRLNSLQAVFSAPANHGEPLTIKCNEKSGELLNLTIRQQGQEIQRISIGVIEGDAAKEIAISDAPVPRSVPRSFTLADANGLVGSFGLAIDRRRLGWLFPSLARLLPASQLAVLLASTRIVGMECPGLRSIFADLTLRFETSAPDSTMRFRTIRADPRLSVVRIGLHGGGASGEITALFRPDPVTQPSAADIAHQVRKNEFAGQHALVIGGSRGLGEVTAKLLALGGAEVAITFFRGREDAIQVTQDIVANGGRCRFFQFDVVRPPQELSDEQLLSDFRPTHLYFFATPPIQLVKGQPFSKARFYRFCDYYVSGLADVVSSIYRLFPSGGTPLALLYPSTMFLDKPPSGAAEYSAAKAAGEILCQTLARTRPGLRVACPRLPTLRTDQTNSLHSKNNVDRTVPVLLEVLRKFH